MEKRKASTGSVVTKGLTVCSHSDLTSWPTK